MIKAGQLQNFIVARAFPKPPSKFRHLVAEETGKSADEGIARLIDKLDALRTQRRAIRRRDPSLAAGVPTSEEYADALRSLSPGPKMLTILHDRAILSARGMEVRELAKTGEFASPKDLPSAYEKLGMQLFNEIEPSENLKAGLNIVLHVPEDRTLEDNDFAVLQPELRDAVMQLTGSDRLQRSRHTERLEQPRRARNGRTSVECVKSRKHEHRDMA